MSEKDIEEIKKEKLEQLKQEKESEGSQKKAQEQMEAQKKAILRKAMTPDARERLGRVRVARPQLAEKIESQVVSLAQRGAQGKIDDETLKKLLKKLSNDKKEINIKRR